MKNLRKLFVTAIAVAASSMAFAGNTYDVKDLVTGFFSFTEQMPTTELTPEEQMAVNTAKALEKGLLTYAENLSKRELTATDRKIDTTLNTQIPAIVNKIQESSLEVQDELNTAVKDLQTAVLANQSQYTVSGPVVDQVAPGLLILFAYTKAEADGVLLGRASRVLQQELAAMFQTMIEGMLEEDDE